MISPSQVVVLYDVFDGLSPGYYLAETYDMTYTYTHSIPESAALLDCWLRNSTTTGYVEDIPGGILSLPPQTGSEKIELDEATAIIKTTIYKITQKLLAGIEYEPIDPVWYPKSPEEVVVNYSLHIYDPLATTVENEVNIYGFSLYPNPAADQIVVYLETKLVAPVFELYSIDGKLLEMLQPISASNSKYIFNINNYTPGAYIIRIQDKIRSMPLTFIKQ